MKSDESEILKHLAVGTSVLTMFVWGYIAYIYIFFVFLFSHRLPGHLTTIQKGYGSSEHSILLFVSLVVCLTIAVGAGYDAIVRKSYKQALAFSLPLLLLGFFVIKILPMPITA